MENTLPPKVVIMMMPAVALATLPHWRHVPNSLLIFFTLMWLWRAVALWKPDWLPGSKLLTVVLLSALALLYGQHTGEWGRDAGTSIFVVALGLKLLEINKPRDVYLTAYLTLIVAAAQFLYLQSIVIALLGGVVFLILMTALIGMNPSIEMRHAMRTCTSLLVQAAPLAALLFLAFPRFQAPAWMMLEGDSHQAHSGLSNTLRPGAINDMLLSAKLAFRVKFTGEAPPRNQMYWRGPVFSYTDGENWRVSESDFVIRFQDEMTFEGPRYDYTLLMEPQDQSWVFALDMPDQYPANLRRDANYQIISRTKPGEAAEFFLSSRPFYNTGYITRVEYRENRQLPEEPSKEIKALVQSLGGNDPQHEQFIENVLNHFRQGGFLYTLQPQLLDGNRIERFLLESKQGYCEHFATGFVYLMRVADIPSRVVSGFQGGQYNAVGNFYEIRQANAHAWAEVWLEGKGWIRVDPTSAVLPTRIEQPVNVESQVETRSVSLMSNQAVATGAASAPEQVSQFWDNVDYQWQRWIVGYGSEQQTSFLGRAGLKKLAAIVFWLAYILVVVAVIITVWVFRQPRRSEAAEVLLYRRFCKKMAKAGLLIGPGEGAKTFGERAAQQLPEQAQLIEQITDHFICLRYQPSATKQDLRALKLAVQKISICSPKKRTPN